MLCFMLHMSEADVFAIVDEGFLLHEKCPFPAICIGIYKEDSCSGQLVEEWHSSQHDAKDIRFKVLCMPRSPGRSDIQTGHGTPLCLCKPEAPMVATGKLLMRRVGVHHISPGPNRYPFEIPFNVDREP